MSTNAQIFLQDGPKPITPSQSDDQNKDYSSYLPAEGPQIKQIAMIVGVLVILIVAGYAIYTLKFQNHTPPGQTTTISVTQVLAITSCTRITHPGIYHLDNNIATKQTQGACIEIDSDNVKFNGNGHSIKGNGPYVDIPPFTYGVLVNSSFNVTVNNLNITRFSYDFYTNKVSDSQFSDIFAGNSTLTDIYLLDTTSSDMSNVTAYQALSAYGGMVIMNGGNNTISGSKAGFNSYRGVVVESIGNRFINDRFTGNPVDMFCNSTASYAPNNKFISSTCATNQFCNFARCTYQNQLYNTTLTLLSSSQINSCGQIYRPGTYTMTHSLTLLSYLNGSELLSQNLPCITIASPNVKFNCANNMITDSGYAISVTPGTANVTIMNCKFMNDTNGVYMSGTFGGSLQDLQGSFDKYNVYLYNTTFVNVTNSTFTKSNTGVYLSGGSSTTVTNVTTNNNTYGSYLDNNIFLNFFNDTSVSNKNTDMFCDAGTYNQINNKASNVKCGVTDCLWFSCNTKTLPPVLIYPISSCMKITNPGNYLLDRNLIAPSTCFTIASSNVIFNCNFQTITSAASTGNNIRSGFLIFNQTNVTITNCDLQQFNQGINASNTKDLNVFNSTINSELVGIVSTNASDSNFQGITISNYSNEGMIFTNLIASNVIVDDVSSGSKNSSGVVFKGASHDNITSVISSYNPQYGFKFIRSNNNYIQNNTAADNQNSDYYCSPSSSNVIADNGGINTGASKVNCNWLAAIPVAATPVACDALLTPGTISITEDQVYPYGAACFIVGAKVAGEGAQGTTINCNGHLIYSTSGGTFVDVVNGSSTIIQNCVLKGFADPIIASSDSTAILNNTIDSTNTSIILTSRFDNVKGNRITGPAIGIYLNNVTYATLKDNQMNSTQTGIVVSGGTQDTFVNNTASINVMLGMSLLNTLANRFTSNKFMGTNGISCNPFSANSVANFDSGSNSCSINTHCAWMQTSASCKPT